MTVQTITPPPVLREHDSRLATLRRTMITRGFAAVAVAGPENIYYLTGLDHLGYFAFSLLIVPAEGQPVVITRDMERPTVRAQIPDCRHVTFHDGADPALAAVSVLLDLVPPDGTVAMEQEALFFPPAIRDRIVAGLPGRSCCEATEMLHAARAVKSEAEIARMKHAAAVSDTAMQAGLAAAGPGVSEWELAAAIHDAMFRAGGGTPGFPPLIRPLAMLDQEHVTWSDRFLRAGTGLFVELSGCVARYHAPLSRVVHVGEPPAEAVRAHAIAVRGLAAACDALRPGVLTGDVFTVWQEAVADAGGGRPPRHHCGYLVGIGFPPSWVGGGEVLGIRSGGTVPIQAGMTFHVMSWVAGAVISDTALITATGSKLLTKTTRELLVVGN